MKANKKVLVRALFIIFLGVIIKYSIIQSNNELASLHRLDACQVEMQKAIPDPNDTEARSLFLENCN